MLQPALALQMMQPQALRYFADVVKSGSLRLAAQKYNVAPSAISRQIARLERDLRVKLFNAPRAACR